MRDVPAMMRDLADRIEAGEFGDGVKAVFVLQREGDYPLVFGWGDITPAETVMELEMAKLFMCQNVVGRR